MANLPCSLSINKQFKSSAAFFNEFQMLRTIAPTNLSLESPPVVVRRSPHKMMLKAKVLPKILNQAVSSGVKNAIIITLGGDLLTTTGGDSNDKLVGAIVLNIWNSLKKAADDLNCLLIDNEHGRLAITKAGEYLICAYGDQSAEFGMLKAKVEALQKYLDDPLKQLHSDPQLNSRT